jgi:hypothetical protein
MVFFFVCFASSVLAIGVWAAFNYKVDAPEPVAAAGGLMGGPLVIVLLLALLYDRYGELARRRLLPERSEEFGDDPDGYGFAGVDDGPDLLRGSGDGVDGYCGYARSGRRTPGRFGIRTTYNEG